MHLFHDWEIVSVEHRRFDKLDRDTLRDSLYKVRLWVETKETLVLYKCKTCGKVKTITLDGHWTKEQLMK